MLTLSNPEHGWITLEIGDDLQVIEVTFSDVGPDSLEQLCNALKCIKAGDKAVVEFYLEPEVEVVTFDPKADKVAVASSLSGYMVHVTRNDLVADMTNQLKHVIPLCNGHNWTYPTAATIS